MANTDFRFDPFRQVFRPVVQTNEPHVAQYFDALGRVGFFTREAVQRRSPSSVVLKDSAVVTLSEVSRTTIPTYSTYRVDYSALTFWSHCFIEVHETRIGEAFTITYHGLGTGLNSSNRSDDRFNIERSVSVAGGVTADSMRVLGAAALLGSVFLGIATGSTISCSGQRIQNVGDAVLDTDLLNMQTLLAINASAGVRVFTSGSGSWTAPVDKRYVFIAMIGSGGAGAAKVGGPGGAAGGGAGSGALYAVIDLDVLGAGPYAYSVAAGVGTNFLNIASNGAHSTMFGCNSGRGLGGEYNIITGVGTGGLVGNGTLGAAVVTGKLVTTDHLGASAAGGANSGTTSGAGGHGSSMLGNAPAGAGGAGSARLYSGTGGAAVGVNTNGIAGGIYGAGGSGGGGGIPDFTGGGSGGGLILLIY